MRVFTVELSSRFGSIALVEDGVTLKELCWEENFKDRQQLFDAIADMETDWSCVDVFAVGRGPGAFSGMRIGFSVINSLAAPSRKPVYALNSGAALAAQCGASRTVIVGDARRNQVWAGIFTCAELENEFKLMSHDEFHDFVPPDTLVVSPDHCRLADLLADFRSPDGLSSLFPSAGKLGELVCRRLEKGIASESFEPLYMHPPVFISPRFPI